ncbi:DNA-processing protein DprA [Leptospira wolffii]|uniref:DNA-processing protein DprA n=1 Tax=Leptospira wolffii TaxID=409998 RepID=UPI001084509D|nr:DNA-processing protein DprA [Leptospira wolffii]TGK62342.1 DNA-processing protein DprA [Leptospira wolffii]TGK68141.1 DNA-processing protein DprA [Leptospira wolffii]TGK74274.1 DNA-processing protein DprA [Leptospira wolffii]TGL32151.1 DNA-processing protein DprA [Leptospira wolffii]
MDFLSLSSPSLLSILAKGRILSSSSDEKEAVKTVESLLPKEVREKIRIETSSYIGDLKRLGACVLSYFDPNYPELLREIYDPPPNLFCFGDVSALNRKFLAVVGTRKVSPVTLAYCGHVSDFLSSLQMEGIISGLALGVDAACMSLGLEKGLPVVGVMGTGPEKEYPFENRNIYSVLKNSPNCAIVTEYPPGFRVGKYAFPKRNRIITGIASALLLMEAPSKSGALSSASNALSQNREIYVFNHPYQLQNEGGRRLISEGAIEVSLQEDTGNINVFHTSEILPDNFEELPGMLALIGKQTLNGNWTELGSGFLQSNT